MQDELIIAGLGAVTPVGVGADQTCASVRAGLSGLRRHPWFYARLPEPLIDTPERVVCGVADDLAIAERSHRILKLTAAALRDLIESSGLSRRELAQTQVSVCVGGSERAPETAFDLDRFASALTRRVGVALQLRLSFGDQTTLLQWLAESVDEQAARRIIVGADTLVDDDSLSWLDARDRLRSERNGDGFLAGEAAACVLLEGAASLRARAGRAFGVLRAVGQGSEANPIGGEKNSTARGLCDAIKAATADWDGAPVPWAVCDMTGESYWAYEWGLARARLGQTLGATDLWHPADCMGVVGAASSALAIVVAARALAHDYAPASRALIWCGSDGERRAACTLEAMS